MYNFMIYKDEFGTRQAFGLVFSSPPQCLSSFLSFVVQMHTVFSYVVRNICCVMLCCSIEFCDMLYKLIL